MFSFSSLEDWVIPWSYSFFNNTFVETPFTKTESVVYPYSWLFVPIYFLFLFLFGNILPFMGSHRALMTVIKYVIKGTPIVLGLTGFSPRTALHQLILGLFGPSSPDKMIRSTSTISLSTLVSFLIVLIAVLCYILSHFYLKNKDFVKEPVAPSFSQKVVFNNIQVENINKDELAVIITLADSYFETEPSIFNSDQKKINYVIKELTGPLRVWAARQLYLNPSVKTSYTKFCDHLFNQEELLPSLPLLRTEYFNKKQGNQHVKVFIQEMEDLASKLHAKDDDTLHLIMQGLNEDFKRFMIHHRLPEGFNQAKSDLIYFYERFLTTKNVTIHVNNISARKGPLSHEEKMRRRLENLCLYCGSADHKVATCQLIAKRDKNSAYSTSSASNDSNKVNSSYFSIHINLIINDQEVVLPAMLDSGADTCLMSEEISKGLKIPLNNKSFGLLANGTSFVMFDTPLIKFKTQTLFHEEVFKVSNNLLHPIVLGLPWWVKNSLQFDYDNNNVLLDGFPVPILDKKASKSFLCASSTISLPNCLEPYIDVFSDSLSKELPPHRAMDLKIDLMPGKQPPHGKIIPLSVAQSQVLKKYLDDQLSSGFMSLSKSPCSSPIFFIKKKDGELRPCVDYRKINDITIKNRYPLPSSDMLSEKLFGAKVFSKVDLRSAFNQLRIAEGHEWKTAIRTCFGLYEYNVMPFGLCNAPSAFQAFINEVLFSLIDQFVIIYLDDILIYSSDEEQHKIHLSEVFSRLKSAKLFCKISKCQFFCTEIEFLGYLIKPGGFAMTQNKIKALQDYPIPKNRKDLRSFLGLANFSRRFVHNFSKIALPLTELTKTTNRFAWNPAAEEAFNILKQQFISSPLLVTPDVSKEFILECDASNFAMGAVLKQYHNGKLHPVAYYSRKLSSAELNYHVYDKEMLAIVKSLQHWRQFLEGAQHPVIIHTDHKNLIYFTESRVLNQRQARWAIDLLAFDFKIKYIPGHLNIIPDALSRRPDHFDESAKNTISDPVIRPEHFLFNLQTTIHNPIDDEIIEAQQSSVEFTKYKNNELSEDWTIKHNYLLFKDRIWVPTDELRSQIISLFHDTVSGGHNGFNKTLRHISSRYIWRGLQGSVKRYIKNCDVCIRNKNQNQRPLGLLCPLEQANFPWKTITMDFITGLPVSLSFDAILVIVDRFTKYSLFIPCNKTCTASDLATIFINKVFTYFGTPSEVISDRGTVFTSQFWNEFASQLNIKLKFSSAYHPQTDGQTERMNQVLEQYLRCFINVEQDNWVSLLKLAQFNYNATVHTSIGMSPAKALFGFDPEFSPGRNISSTNPGVLDRLVELREIRVHLRSNLTKAIASFTTQANKKRRDGEFQIGDKVYLSSTNLPLSYHTKKLAPKRVGPFEITRKLSKVAYELSLPNHWLIHNIFHISLLTKAPDSLPINVQIPELQDTAVTINPERILDHKVRYRKLHFLIKWEGLHPEEATWEKIDNLLEHINLINTYLEKKGLVLEGDNVMIQ